MASGTSLIELKVVLSLLIFISGGLGVLLPWATGKGAPSWRFTAYGNTFAGGILGGAGLVHLLSGGAREFRTIAPEQHYPLAFVLAGGGFLLILLIEAVILADQTDTNVSLLHGGPASACHEVGPHALPFRSHSVLYVLLPVLSIHSVIVGMALGAQSSESEALVVFIAIVAHKMAAGFALGISYRRARATLLSSVRVAAFFSSMTPLGILAGTGVEALTSRGGRQLFEAIFDSVGAGTFLYIASVDIIRTEFERRGDRWQKWLLATLGFSMIAVLARWI